MYHVTCVKHDSFPQKEPLVIGFFCGKWPMTLHPHVPRDVCDTWLLWLYATMYHVTYVWHDSFPQKEPLFIGFFCGKWPIKDKASYGSVISVTWMISLKNVGHDSIMCAIWPVHICDMRIFMRHRSLSLIRDIPRSSIGHETIMCVTWLSHMCDMDGFDLGWFCFRMVFLADGTWLQSCVRHDPCMCAIRCIHMCDRITHTNVHTLTVIAHCERYTYTYIDTYMDAQMYTHKCAHTNVHTQMCTQRPCRLHGQCDCAHVRYDASICVTEFTLLCVT